MLLLFGLFGLFGLLPPLQLPLWYAGWEMIFCTPCDWFLALLDLFESFYVCYMCSYFQTDLFHSGMVHFFYMILYRFIAGYEDEIVHAGASFGSVDSS